MCKFSANIHIINILFTIYGIILTMISIPFTYNIPKFCK